MSGVHDLHLSFHWGALPPKPYPSAHIPTMQDSHEAFTAYYRAVECGAQADG